MTYSASDQHLVDTFVKALCQQVTAQHGPAIDFIILFGSAARGEFIPGVSDIDLVIQTKDASAVATIEHSATQAFWELNAGMKTGFEKSCATKTSQNVLGRIFGQLEESVHLYTPLFVYGPGDLDWENGRVRKFSIALQSQLWVSQATIFQKFKTEGKVYYGRDIRPLIHPHFTWWERWKGLCIPVHLSFFALLVALIVPRRAVKYAVKAILYSIDSSLIYLGDHSSRPRPQKVEALKQIVALPPDMPWQFLSAAMGSIKLVLAKDFALVDRALAIKLHGFRGTAWQALQFVGQAWWFIVRLSGRIIFSSRKPSQQR